MKVIVSHSWGHPMVHLCSWVLRSNQSGWSGLAGGFVRVVPMAWQVVSFAWVKREAVKEHLQKNETKVRECKQEDNTDQVLKSSWWQIHPLVLLVSFSRGIAWRSVFCKYFLLDMGIVIGIDWGQNFTSASFRCLWVTRFNPKLLISLCYYHLSF